MPASTTALYPLFSYGTIQNQEVQKELFGKTLPFNPDSIAGFEVLVDLEIGGSVYPRLKEKRGGLVLGSVFELTSEQLEMLDVYETEAYVRELIKTSSGQRVFVYFERR